MQSEPTQEHHWLRRLVGEWTMESSCVMGPGAEPLTSRGTEKVRAVGDLWIVAEGQGEMPGGGPMTSIMTLGYDPLKKKFVGTWIGSPMAFMFVYEGSMDRDGKTLPLEATGPSFTDPTKMTTYRDVITVHDADHRTLTSFAPDGAGGWQQFMSAVYRRVR
ncbi:MAG: DUF1579 domain-containing protein [Planctomycetota bacterium]|nr:DUF1579 domain-containing protein [Planctomycetota bacterium]